MHDCQRFGFGIATISKTCAPRHRYLSINLHLPDPPGLQRQFECFRDFQLFLYQACQLSLLRFGVAFRAGLRDDFSSDFLGSRPD